MAAKILDGKKASDSILQQVRKEVSELRIAGIAPKLVVIQVGEDPASTIYVNKKHSTCLGAGMDSEVKRLPENVSYEELLSEIRKLNEDKGVHGILLQLPLPQGLAHRDALATIAPEKDVDGLNPINHGKAMLGKDAFVPATPKGIMTLLEATKIKLAGKSAVVIGRSNIVGKPVAMLLLNADCTVTMCHSRTKKLADYTKKADIIVSAVGKPKLVKANMVKRGAIVIDVGTTKNSKGKLLGDVDFKKVARKASWITPVPGGVGPMTIASLMQNTLKAARQIEKV
ncbi:MAG TPA: bifunctional methylenetetrahydrofolate dehydrogenase/methenyltetrahydrofolate cyclohydrolase [Candidatus Diapherotrites archaeon]|uniref:Bifunctional protein FolD n=1 Tax=Candidatus Iainarchaeum sp. TaxID=3101447 RepID=A0A7J4J2D3_9ARCH|nr:bifunctional methylenetetrahydrofolate dehydrogenase/methenyltetrahydrofolate cyclohydrolase [Candidatus Diapherotrites archaeon]